MKAQAIADFLLETSLKAPNIATDQLRWQWKNKERWGSSSVPVAQQAVRGLERGMEASAAGMEGQPSPEELRAEQAKYRKHDPVPRTPKNSVTMATNRNLRRKSFGYKDTYSMRDRKWPTDPSYHRKVREPLPEPPSI